MGTKRDYYETLGIDRSAGAEDVKKAYRRLALECHPDRKPGDPDAEQRFKEATLAYEVLRDPEKRARYDRYGHAGFEQPEFGGFGFGGIDLGDALRIFMRDLGGFGGMFGDFGASAADPQTVRGENLRASVRLTLSEIAEGAEKKIRFKRRAACKACSGTGAKDGKALARCSECGGGGRVQVVRDTLFGRYARVGPCRRCGGRGRVIEEACPDCRGDGREEKSETVSIRIPAGVSTGNYVELRGRGNAGPHGGDAGDLIVFIEEEEDKVFERHDEHLLLDVAITMSQAVLGDEIEIPTVTGRAKLKIPRGTASGRIFRLRGKGLPRLHGSGSGDQLVRVHVWTPRKVGSKQKSLYRELEGLDRADLPPVGKAVLEAMRKDDQ